MKEKGTISIHTENIFPIIKKFLYSDHEIFLRELVSNAVDATQKIKRLAALGEFKGELGDLTVDVSFDEKAKTITIEDKGIGMTAEEIKKYINQIAFSGATEFVEKFKDAKDTNEIIGKFGLGFYSAFMVSDKVEIETLSWQENSKPAKWICDGSTEFEITTTKKPTRGTRVILHVMDDEKDFLNQQKLQGILDKYSKFLPITVRFGTKDEQKEDGKDKEGKPKYKTVQKDNIINETDPIWLKSPSELKDEDYISFYKTLYPMSEDPLFWIHLNVDHPFNLTGILYFPKVRKDFDFQRNKIQLYSRQVFITDEVKDIVPEFLTLLYGVVDSPDIPLNVSRSFLQADGNVKKINSYITKKVADKLAELFKKDRKKYEEKWDSIGVFVKYGVISEEKFSEKADKFTLLKNINNEYFTLDEYKKKVEGNQVDKDKQTIYLYSTDSEAQQTYIDAAQNRNYDILLFEEALDAHYINKLEQSLEKTNLKRVDADSMDKLIEKDVKVESILSETAQNKLKKVYEDAIKEENVQITLEPLATDDLPLSITQPEFMRRMADMQKVGGGGMPFMGNMPSMNAIVVNSNHPLANKILKTRTEEKKIELARQSYDLALLSQGMLKGKDLSAFIKRSLSLVI